jgi:hypothetical protein
VKANRYAKKCHCRLSGCTKGDFTLDQSAIDNLFAGVCGNGR